MCTLQENSYKKISIESKSKFSPELLMVNGVSKLEMKGNSADFIYKGNINSILKKLTEIELRNISIEEPDLEEIFMHYYAKED
jgi:ABC-2 type transport system ATP-binding protein